MITVYMPPGKSTFNVDKEIALARNIKSKQTRTSVLQGLNKISNYL